MKNRIIIICFSLIGYTTNSNFVQILTNDVDKSFWLQQKRTAEGIYIYTNNQWVFYPDGTAKGFVSFNPKIKGHSLYMNVEGTNDSKWSYSFRDSVLDIGSGAKYKIIKYNKDTISMSINKNYFLLIRKH
ncbi:MAG: hypothetical protein ACXVAY_06465 [Mucilaginibacter sp.]